MALPPGRAAPDDQSQVEADCSNPGKSQRAAPRSESLDEGGRRAARRHAAEACWPRRGSARRRQVRGEEANQRQRTGAPHVQPGRESLARRPESNASQGDAGKTERAKNSAGKTDGGKTERAKNSAGKTDGGKTAAAKASAAKALPAPAAVRLDTPAKIRPIEQAVGVSSDAVARRTGKSWGAVVRALGRRRRAAQLDHKGIVAVLAQRHGVGPWWQQMVTVAYEQARGKNGNLAADDGFQWTS